METTPAPDTMPSPTEGSHRARRKPLGLWVALGVVLGVVFSLLCQPGAPLGGLEMRALDSRFAFRSEAPIAEHVAIIAIDERSLSDPRLGRWPWDRTWHARLIDRLMTARPQAIAFDVLFPEASSPQSDAALARAIRQAGCVFLGAHLAPGGQRRTGGAEKLLWQPEIVVGRQLLPQAGVVAPPTAPLLAAAAGGGVVGALPDPDGLVRRVFLLVQEGSSDQLYPTLPLAVTAYARGWSASAMKFDLRQRADLSPTDHVPFDSRGRALINYLGPAGTVRSHSFVDIIDGRFNPRDLQGKILLVGTTAPGLSDDHPTPLSPSMHGVEIHAQTVENLWQHCFLHEVSFGNGLALTLLFAVLAALCAGLLRPLIGLGLLAVAMASYLVGGLSSFSNQGAMWPVAAPSLAAVLAFLTIGIFRLSTEEAGRRRLKAEFGRYAPPQVVARLDSGEMKVRAAGVKRPITALFADVRGFTAWSATADPREVVAVLNTYFESMTQLAFDLEGTVDNIVGDEIFVTFNAVEDQADHPSRAVNLALNMMAALDGLNEKWQAAGVLREPLRIGIGVNTGEALVGSLGSHIRTQYTVLGQVVNLASRLQSLNKELGTSILITTEVAATVEDEFNLQSMGLQEVRGHPVPVEVYAVLGRVQGDMPAPGPAPAPGSE